MTTTSGHIKVDFDEAKNHNQRKHSSQIEIDWNFNPLTAEWALRALIDFTLFNARRFYSSMGNPLDGKGSIVNIHWSYVELKAWSCRPNSIRQPQMFIPSVTNPVKPVNPSHGTQHQWSFPLHVQGVTFFNIRIIDLGVWPWSLNNQHCIKWIEITLKPTQIYFTRDSNQGKNYSTLNFPRYVFDLCSLQRRFQQFWHSFGHKNDEYVMYCSSNIPCCKARGPCLLYTTDNFNF